jgi:hypothetical protein
MAFDSTALFVGQTGHAYVAPVGSTAPTDVTTAWAAAWLDLGYLTPDGITINPGQTTADVNVWQDQYPIRRIHQTSSLAVQFTLKQWTGTTLPLLFGGGTVATATGVSTYTPPTAGVVDERALGLEFTDGSTTMRWVIKRGMVSDVGGAKFHRAESADAQVTFQMFGSSSSAPFTVISNLAALAAA